MISRQSNNHIGPNNIYLTNKQPTSGELVLLFTEKANDIQTIVEAIDRIVNASH